MNNKNYSKAIEKATFALEVVKSEKSYFRRGKAYEAKRDYDKAISDYEEAYEIGKSEESMKRLA